MSTNLCFHLFSIEQTQLMQSVFLVFFPLSWTLIFSSKSMNATKISTNNTTNFILTPIFSIVLSTSLCGKCVDEFVWELRRHWSLWLLFIYALLFLILCLYHMIFNTNTTIVDDPILEAIVLHAMQSESVL